MRLAGPWWNRGIALLAGVAMFVLLGHPAFAWRLLVGLLITAGVVVFAAGCFVVVCAWLAKREDRTRAEHPERYS